jgi:hypothetical protein
MRKAWGFSFRKGLLIKFYHKIDHGFETALNAGQRVMQD